MSRERFEKWISSPPYERDTERFGPAMAWPGQYVDIGVQLAWEAWEEALKVAQEPPVPDAVLLSYMRDNHTFVTKKITEPCEWEAIARWAEFAIRTDDHGYGSLCQPILSAGDKEVARVGHMHHLKSKQNTEHTEVEIAAWLSELQANPDIKRIVEGA
jgi:hypothetical protein